MASLLLHDFHKGLGGQFTEVNGQEAVAHYGDWQAEHRALYESAGVMDLSYRSRLCLLGNDRVKFLNGQVTNNVKDLKTGEGCYAAIVSAKGKIESDLHIYILEDEILLEFEPGFTEAVQQRLQKYVITEDVQIADVSNACGLWSVQGPKAAEALERLPWNFSLPAQVNALTKIADQTFGDIYVVNRARTKTIGYDIFVPHEAMNLVADPIIDAVRAVGGAPCGWQALEIARIESGIPRFGVDMDAANLAPEALGADAISYDKGCYIGQEVIARIRTYGQVAKSLRGLRLPDQLPALPAIGAKLFLGDKDAGYLTSAVNSPRFKANIALGYARREANQIGTELLLQINEEKVTVKIVELPFVK